MPFSGGDSAGAGEQINHLSGITLRITGQGVLRSKLYGFDDVKTKTLVIYHLQSAPGRAPFLLANFVNQRMRLELKCTGIDEYFRVNRIVMHLKEIYTSHPLILPPTSTTRELSTTKPSPE